jgi:two-component system OmpR family response regulator/two-component system response regulator RstA
MIKTEMLIVEDDPRLANLIGSFFSRSGFVVTIAETGSAAVKYCQQNNPIIIILDLMLPDISGITVCKQLRDFYSGRILMLTASASDIDQIDGFESGVDDYVVKPVEPSVLLARVNSLIKRKSTSELTSHNQSLSFDGLKIDNISKSVHLDSQLMSLTSHEFELMYLLAKNAGSVLSRDNLYKCLRGFGYDGSNRSIDLKISRLRKKLNDDASHPEKIKTIWGQGYLFVATAWSH